MEEVVVGMGDMKIVKGEFSLVTYALGSCVGVCLYDEQIQVGGMLHAMLPQSNGAYELNNIYRYVDTGLHSMYQAMIRRGAVPGRMKAKLLGGAKMFEYHGIGNNGDIGTSNVNQVHKILQEYKVPIVREETGGSVGRTIHFTPMNGLVKIITSEKVESTI